MNLWANQGVLLLNSVLTVESGKPNSHKNKGWEQFTESVISKISERKKISFFYYGVLMHKKENHLFKNDHLILKVFIHHRFQHIMDFLGLNHFLKQINFFKKHNIKEIVW